MKKIYEVEIRGQKQKTSFDTLQQAKDYALVVAGFGGKQYRIQTIIVRG
jgi:hypothetical protein